MKIPLQLEQALFVLLYIFLTPALLMDVMVTLCPLALRWTDEEQEVWLLILPASSKWLSRSPLLYMSSADSLPDRRLQKRGPVIMQSNRTATETSLCVCLQIWHKQFEQSQQFSISINTKYLLKVGIWTFHYYSELVKHLPQTFWLQRKMDKCTRTSVELSAWIWFEILRMHAASQISNPTPQCTVATFVPSVAPLERPVWIMCVECSVSQSWF